ncbi:MAG: hypothetical protein V4543_04730 [Bacteroidota bacterium]
MQKPADIMAETYGKLNKPHAYSTDLLLLAVIYIISRVCAYIAGIRFDVAECIGDYWQLADTKLLKTDLLSSIWYMYGQPPLFNLFTGLSLKAFPQHYPAALHAVFILFGLIIIYGIYSFLRILKVRRPVVLLISVFWVLSPASILYENWYFYEYPIQAMLVPAGFFLYKFASLPAGKGFWYALAFFFTLAAVMLTRSMFHPLWFTCLLLSLLWLFPGRRKQVVLSALIPIVMLVAWPVKNYVVFGVFSSSGWFGMNLYKTAGHFLPLEDANAMVDAGDLPPACRYLPFRRSINDYWIFMPTKPNPYPRIPILADTMKSDGHVNFHHYGFIEISEQYNKGAFILLSQKPVYYLKSLGGAFVLWFESATSYLLLAENREKIGGYDSFFNLLSFRYSTVNNEHSFNFIAFASSGLCFWYYFSRFGRAYYKIKSRTLSPADILHGYIAFTVLFITLTGIALEFGENNRFRFQIQPFMLVLTGFSADAFYRLFQKPKQEKLGK